MSKLLNIVVLGASGAVGSQAVEVLSRMTNVRAATLLVRRALAGPIDPRFSAPVVTTTDPASYRAYLDGADAAVCTFGVGNSSGLSKEEFVRIDHDAVLAFAEACKASGVDHFELLSAVGADPSSRLFYLRCKGRLEADLAGLNFRRLSLFRPSNILTPKNRYGLSQAFILAVWPHLNPILRGSWRKYRGIRVEALGAAMAKNVNTAGSGKEILHWDDFTRLAALPL